MALWPFGRHKKRARKGDDEATTTTTTTATTANTTTATAAVQQPQPQTPPAQTEAATKTATTGGHHGHGGLSAGKLVRRDSKRQKYSAVPPAAAAAAATTTMTPTAATATSTSSPATPATAATADSPMTLPAGRALRQPTSVDTFASVNALAPSKLRQAEQPHIQNAAMPSHPLPSQVQGEGSSSSSAYPVPTLHHGKRYLSEPTSILRRRSERRRRIDPERELEIKRMGSLVWEHPKRSSAATTTNSNNVNNNNNNNNTSNKDKHLSDPFTPSSTAANAAASSTTFDQAEPPSHTFKLSALNALSPRPFLRYASSDGNRSSLPATADISRSSTTRDKAKPRWFSADQAAATAGSSKKINELADTMDAGALRQLMDRDRRRRLVKRQILREQQQQQQQQQASAAARQADKPVEQKDPVSQPKEPQPEVDTQTQSQTQPLEKIVSAGTASIPSSSPDPMDVSKPQSQQQSLEPAQSWLQDASKESLIKEDRVQTAQRKIEEEEPEPESESGEHQGPAAPLATVLSRNGQPIELAIPADERRDEIPDIRQHPAFRQPSVSETSASASASVSASASTKPSTMLNETKLGRTWTQLFRRRGTLRRKPNRNILPKNSSSEFSVTSRTHPYVNPGAVTSPPIAIAATASSHRVGTDTQSITSKFTEHLDDGSASGSAIQLSTSAPGGPRMYSPEPLYNLHREDSYSVSVAPSQRMSGAEKYSISGISAGGAGTGTGAGTYMSGPDTRPNSTFLAQSLASIDSEGSWLSGRPSRRLSQAPLKSPGSTRERLNDDVSPIIDPDLEDDNAISSDEYFGALPVPKEEEEDTVPKHGLNITTSNDSAIINPAVNGYNDDPDAAEISPLPEDADDGMALANADGDPPTWHSSVGKQPRLINPENRAKSREGLFTEFIDSENEVSPIDEPEGVTEIRRAQSVDLGRHIRHISAGSAKLVTLSRAESSGKRHSNISQSSSGVFPTRTDDDI